MMATAKENNRLNKLGKWLFEFDKTSLEAE
jgi:hypothetical protein